eukprot:gene6460-4222_t
MVWITGKPAIGDMVGGGRQMAGGAGLPACEASVGVDVAGWATPIVMRTSLMPIGDRSSPRRDDAPRPPLRYRARLGGALPGVVYTPGVL